MAGHLGADSRRLNIPLALMDTRLSNSAQISATVGLLKEFRGVKSVVRKVVRMLLSCWLFKLAQGCQAREENARARTSRRVQDSEIWNWQ
jgi:hypothetical protein